MAHFKAASAIFLISCTASCANSEPGGYGMPSVTADSYATAKQLPLDPSRRIAEQDCSKPIDFDRGNVLCR